MTTAADFWKQFPVTVSFLEPCIVEGRLLSYEAVEGADGSYPRLVMRTRAGSKVIVNATQTRLISQLHEACPDKGDILRIEYFGPAGRAAPGRSPTKEFTVAVLERYQKPADPPAASKGES